MESLKTILSSQMKVLKALISGFTREAGVRSLEREVGSVCRKVAKRVVDGETGKTLLSLMRVVTELMGAPRFQRDEKLEESQVGVATGSSLDTGRREKSLFIEALKMKGKGGLILTGQLGDVMKESARAAMSYAKAHHEELGIDIKVFEESEIHISTFQLVLYLKMVHLRALHLPLQS